MLADEPEAGLMLLLLLLLVGVVLIEMEFCRVLLVLLSVLVAWVLLVVGASWGGVLSVIDVVVWNNVCRVMLMVMVVVVVILCTTDTTVGATVGRRLGRLAWLKLVLSRESIYRWVASAVVVVMRRKVVSVVHLVKVVTCIPR